MLHGRRFHVNPLAMSILYRICNLLPPVLLVGIINQGSRETYTSRICGARREGVNDMQICA